MILFGAFAVSALLGPTVHIDTAAETLTDRVSVNHGLVIVDALVSTALSAAYFVLSWTALRASPGQRFLGMEVVGEHDGARVTVGRGTARWLLVGGPFAIAALVSSTLRLPALDDGVIAASVAVWYVALLVSIVASPTKQGLHDRVAGTVVSKEARAVAWTGESARGEARVR